MHWDEPERRWEFAIGDDPPRDLPDVWAAATTAVTRDLRCRQHGRTIDFHDVWWQIFASDGYVSLGFTATGGADVSGYRAGVGQLLDTTAAQATVWLAESVQTDLAGYEFVQWPIAGPRLLTPQIVDGRASWLDPADAAVVVRIGHLC